MKFGGRLPAIFLSAANVGRKAAHIDQTAALAAARWGPLNAVPPTR